MPRDYKRSTSNRRQSASPLSGALTFLTGLSIGLFVAFMVYLKGPGLAPLAPEGGGAKPEGPLVEGPSAAEPQPASKPRFDFYTILPEREVKVPEWEPQEEATAPPSQVEPGAYIFQVGSFQRFEEADRVKARLALIGLPAEIQKVVINGQDIWYRVRVGPYREAPELNAVRERLAGNNMDFILLRIREGDGEG